MIVTILFLTTSFDKLWKFVSKQSSLFREYIILEKNYVAYKKIIIRLSQNKTLIVKFLFVNIFIEARRLLINNFFFFFTLYKFYES